MEDSERSIRSLIVRYLVAHTQCSGCGRRYAPEDVRLRHRRGDIWLASVACTHCGLQGLIMAAISTDHAHELRSVTGVEAQEAPSLQAMGPISTEEVLDFHCFLTEFSGDVAELLGSSGDDS
jgi:hypothetical protein